VKEADAAKAAADEILTLAKTSPLEAVQKLGMTLPELIRLAAKGGRRSPEEEIQKLRTEMAEKEAATQAESDRRIQLGRQQAVENFKGQIGASLKAQAEKFELVSLEERGVEAVYNVINLHYQATLRETGTPVILEFEDAAQRVEDAIFARDQKRYAASKKLKSFHAPAQQMPDSAAGASPSTGAQPAAPKAPANGHLKPPQPTLSNAQTPSSNAAPVVTAPFVNEEKAALDRAIAAYHQHAKK